MSRIPRARRTGATLFAGVAIGAMALTGCGAGQVASTADQVAATDGTNTNYGSILVRNALIAYPADTEPTSDAVYTAGSDAPLEMVIVNELTEADRLVSVTSEFASSVTITGSTEIPGGRSLVVGSDEGVGGTGGANGNVGGTGGDIAPGSSGSTTSTPPVPTTAPAADGTSEPTSAQMVLTGLTSDIRAGEAYPVVFTFERAGEVRVDIVTAPPSVPREEPEGEGGH